MRVLGLVVATLLFNGAAGAAEVTFSNVESYVDATFDRPRSQRNLQVVQGGLRREFTRLADKHLAAGQTLSVEVTGIDLAGRLEPTFATGDIRVLQSVTWPRLEFNYTVAENGAVVASGKANIHDSGYLDGFNTYPQGDRLRYERRLLSEWFRKTFPRKAV